MKGLEACRAGMKGLEAFRERIGDHHHKFLDGASRSIKK